MVQRLFQHPLRHVLHSSLRSASSSCGTCHTELAHRWISSLWRRRHLSQLVQASISTGHDVFPLPSEELYPVRTNLLADRWGSNLGTFGTGVWCLNHSATRRAFTGWPWKWRDLLDTNQLLPSYPGCQYWYIRRSFIAGLYVFQRTECISYCILR